MSGIGLLNEKPLHASLKAWYGQPGDLVEEAVDGFVIDLVRGDLLLEIQTGHFASIKSKLKQLVCNHRVRLIYPIAQEKWIVKPSHGKNGNIVRRKSPKRGKLEDVFYEMVSFPQLIRESNFSLEVLFINEEETRKYEGMRRWRTRGWAKEEQRLLDVVDRKLFEKPADWRIFIPDTLKTFTTQDLAEETGVNRRLAQKMAYCLRNANVIQLAGKQGRNNLYVLV